MGILGQDRPKEPAGAPPWLISSREVEELDLAIARAAVALRKSTSAPEPAGMLSPAALAERYGVGLGALKKRLERWRRKNLDGWIENREARPREPRFLYDHAKVLPLIEALRRGE